MTAGSLSCENIQVSFGGLKAVNDVSYDFKPGRLYGLIGPNGAGKTTLLDGRDVTHLSVHRRTRGGLGRSFQITKIFAGMSVLENLQIAAFAHRYRLQPFWLPASRFTAVREQAERVLEEVGLTALARRPAEYLSHGDQRALEVGLSLLSEPRVLLLDEPLAGVGHDQLDRAIGLIRQIVTGRTVLLIEHNMDVVMQVSDEIVVMVQGQLLASGSPGDIRANAAVRAAYLGDEA